jgi:hypothetical protein
MAQASDYPVTFPYGATSAPYAPGHPHTGEDRAMPANTEINVGNTILGYVGKTGKATGYHVHVQKYKGGYMHPQGAGLGNSIPFPARVSEVGYNTEIGNFVRLVDAAGVRWSYFHMIKPASVSVGQIINAYVAPAPPPAPQKGDKPMNDAEENEAYQILLERPREGAPSGRTGIAFMRDARNELAQRRAARDAEKVALIKAAQDAQAEAATTRTALSNAATDLQLKAVEVQEKDKAIAELQDKVKQLTPVVKAPVVPAQVDEKTRGVIVKIFALIQRGFTRK